MSLVSSFAVASTAVLALSSLPATRAINLTNNGAGTLLYQVVAHGVVTTLTTGNGTAVAGIGQVNNVQLSPLGASQPSGVDLYLISGTSTTAAVQSVPV